jgi:hypothetical protein
MKHAITLLFLVSLCPLEASQAQDSNKADVQKGKITVLLSGFENDRG